MSVSVFKEISNDTFPILVKDPFTGFKSSRMDLAAGTVNTDAIALWFTGDDVPVHISLGTQGSTVAPMFGLKIDQTDQKNPFYHKRFFIFSTDLHLKWARTDSRRANLLFEEIFDSSFCPSFYRTGITISLSFEAGFSFSLTSSQMQDFFSRVFSKICEEQGVYPHMVHILHKKLGEKENHEIKLCLSRQDVKNLLEWED